jgi:hypothetical protein
MAVQGPSLTGRPCNQSSTITQTRLLRMKHANASAEACECFCIREILFRRLLRQKCKLSVEPAQLSRSPPSLLNALALRRSDRMYTICVYLAMRRSHPAAPRMAPRLQQEELSHPACRCRQATGHMRRRGLGSRRLRESERSKSPHQA